MANSPKREQGGPHVQIENVSKSFDGGKTFAIRGISFTVNKGETVVLLGSSGSGKSTLLRTINRLIEPDEGRVLVRAHDVRESEPAELRRSIGYVSQGIALFPFFRVWENVALPLRLRGIPPAERRARAQEMLELVELPTSVLDRLPSELSGGQQQRVGVARALLTGSDLLLMDEPFGALDAVTRETLQSELVRLRERLGVTILFVTHDLFEALTLADRIGVMHEGCLDQIGPPDEIMRQPKTDFVHELFEKPARQLRLLEDRA